MAEALQGELPEHPTDPTDLTDRSRARQRRARAAQARYAPSEARALGALALAAAAVLLWIIVPVGIGVLLGGLLGFTVHAQCRSLGGLVRKRWIAALLMTIGSTIAVAGTFGLLAYLLVLKGVSVVARLPQAFAPDGPARGVLARLAGPLAPLGFRPDDVSQKLRDLLGDVASSLAGWAAQVVAFVFDGGLALFFMALSMYFVLMHWTELERKVEHMLPLNPNHSRRLMRQVFRLGRQTVIGNLGTALVQGLVAGIGYALAHVPEPAFLGAITSVAALVPAFGTMLVFVPVGLVLILNGHPGAGTFELIWGAVMIVGACDYVVRPRLVGRDETMSVWLMFVALFGGVKVFGVVGFLLGPLVAGLAVCVLRMYARTRRFRLGLLEHEPY